METSKLLKRALWANVVFAEVGALAALFLSGQWAALDQLTNGHGTVLAIELFVLAGIATYAALRIRVSKGLVRLVIALNGLLLLFLLIRAEDTSLSAAGLELVVVEAIAVLGLIVAQVVGLRSPTDRADMARVA